MIGYVQQKVYQEIYDMYLNCFQADESICAKKANGYGRFITG